MTASPAERALEAGREADLPGRRPASRPRPGTGAVAGFGGGQGRNLLQFWLKPGEQAVFFDLGNDPPADPIPAELRPFL